MRSQAQQIEERAALAFWIVVLGICASLFTTLGLAYLRVDLTQFEAATIGAFLGASPIVLMPHLARAALGRNSPFADRGRIEFRALTLMWGGLVFCSRLFDWWPHHHGRTSTAVAILGVVIAILASWFWPHLPAAARIWMRQQLTLPTAPSDKEADQKA